MLGITSFRPFPLESVRDALAGARSVVVLEKALAVGIGGIVANNVRTAVAGLAIDVRTVIAGLGGRPIPGGVPGRDDPRCRRSGRTDLPGPAHGSWSSVNSSATARPADQGPLPRTCCAMWVRWETRFR